MEQELQEYIYQNKRRLTFDAQGIFIITPNYLSIRWTKRYCSKSKKIQILEIGCKYNVSILIYKTKSSLTVCYCKFPVETCEIDQKANIQD